MRNRLWTTVVFGMLGVIAPAARAAQPVITGDLTIIENRPPGDLFGFSGLFLTLRVDVTHADGVGALMGPPANATATSNNPDYPFVEPTPLPYFVWGATGSYFINLLPITAADFPDLDARYTYVVTDNDGEDDQFLGHRLNRMEVIPLPTNLAVSNQTTTPAFSFTDPDPTPNVAGLSRLYQLWIIDANLNGVTVVPSGTTTMNVPGGLLCPCNQYYFRAESFDVDNAEGAAENLATQFLVFRPTDVAPGGDVSHDCVANGRDIAPFITAVLGASTAIEDVCPADFSGNDVVDVADIPGFVNKLLGF